MNVFDFSSRLPSSATDADLHWQLPQGFFHLKFSVKKKLTHRMTQNPNTMVRMVNHWSDGMPIEGTSLEL